MTDDELREFAWDFRIGILGGADKSPESMCFAISAPLASLLRVSGQKCRLMESPHSDLENSDYISHVWIEMDDGRVLDPTFDQFCSEEPVAIYLGPQTEFHQNPQPR